MKGNGSRHGHNEVIEFVVFTFCITSPTFQNSFVRLCANVVAFAALKYAKYLSKPEVLCLKKQEI